MDLLGQVSEFVPFFENKTWMLLKTSKQDPFFISDNPVTLQNKKDFGFYGNLGLRVEGIEIYMPLSNQLSLGIFCPSHEEEITKLHQKFSAIRQKQPEAAALLGDRATYLADLMRGISTGAAISIPHDTVLNLNSLQVRFSSRFVYCTCDCFDLVREMIKTDPRVKFGPQLSFL